MNNCLILGSGRSGTSMLAGILHDAGYFVGEKLYKPKSSNPKGFFEWREINQINEKILAVYGKNFLTAIQKKITQKDTIRNPGKNQRWLLSLSPGINVKNSDLEITERIKGVLKNCPFCYKDPRFSYTLPVWKKFLPADTKIICMFRDPNITIESILTECQSREYLSDLHITKKKAYKVWINMYSHILKKNPLLENSICFVHYNQIFTGSAIQKLAEILEAPITQDFVDTQLNRTKSNEKIPKKVKKIFDQLCDMAHYDFQTIE